MERKLAAILSADVKGYSRMMGQNEVTTIQTLTIYREVMAALIQQHRGRVVDSPGDNLLAEFASVVDAVQGAVAIQRELKARNADLPPDQKMEFRIGINLGDVVVEGQRIYGDGVNIAARVESLAEAGGICLSGTVHEHIKNKLPLGYESLGKREVKNIKDPILVYRVRMDGEETSLQAAEIEHAAEPADIPNSPAAGQAGGPISFSAGQSLIGGGAIGGAVVLVLVFLLSNLSVFGPEGDTAGKSTSWDQPRTAHQEGSPASTLLQPKPSQTPQSETFFVSAAERQAEAIGVMHFKPLKPDPEWDWMQQAIRDNFNSQLRRISGLEVYSREYIDFLVQKGPHTEIEVANQLGIAKMISGSFLVTADTLHIEAHTTNVQTGMLEISDSVEGKQSEFFELQRKLARKIVDRLEVEVSPEQRSVIASGSATPSLDTYKLLLEAEDESMEPGSSQDESFSSHHSDQKTAHSPSRLARWWRGFGVSQAWAAEPLPQASGHEAEIYQILEMYRRAYEEKDLLLLSSIYNNLTERQKEARLKYFQNTQNLQVAVHNVRIAVSGNEAVVSYTREDQFTDVGSGEEVTIDVHLTKSLQHVNGQWKIVAGKK